MDFSSKASRLCAITIILSTIAASATVAYPFYNRESLDTLQRRLNMMTQFSPKNAESSDSSPQVSTEEILLKIIMQGFHEEAARSSEEDNKDRLLRVRTRDRGKTAHKETVDQLSLVTHYVGVGYNIIRGSPDGNFDLGGRDPGILLTRSIFTFTYKKNKEAFYLGKSMKVPDQVNFASSSGCSQKRQSYAFSGAKSYQKELSFKVNPEAKISTFQFSLSAAVGRAEASTAKQRKVILDQKRICTTGQVRYLLKVRGRKFHHISRSFYDSVKQLPSTYVKDRYMDFIEDWGTHFISQADVGSTFVNRSLLKYTDVYRYLNKKASGGIKAGGSLGGNGGSLELSLDYFNTNIKNETSIGSQRVTFRIGNDSTPVPIHMTLMEISEALKPEFWKNLPERSIAVTAKRLRIKQKRTYLERAVLEYPAYVKARKLNDPVLSIPIAWPRGQYALLSPLSSCPDGWSEGYRLQDNADLFGNNNNWSKSIQQRIRGDYGKNIKLYYCTKVKDDDSVFEWPKGTYCIARKGDRCPSSDFREGEIYWDDEDVRNVNERWGELPDGKYDKNTLIHYCCRSDRRHRKEIVLPTDRPFVLYRYGGKCQKVKGTTVTEDYIKFDDNDLNNKDHCEGAHPDDDGCKKNHHLHFCYYSRKN